MNYLDSLTRIARTLPFYGAILGSVIILVLIVGAAVRFLSWRRLLKRRNVFIELTPPAFASRTTEATAQLFSVIHGQRAARTLFDKLLRREVVMALEIVSIRQGGIRYVLQVEEQLAGSLQQAITSYLPDCKVAIVADYLPKASSGKRIVNFRQSSHYAFPLTIQSSLDKHDPVAYLAGAMSKLAPGELIALQIVLKPVELHEARTLSAKILVNADILSQLKKPKTLFLSKLFQGINSTLFGVLDTVSMSYHTQSQANYINAQKDLRERQQVVKRLKPARQMSTFEQQLVQTMHEKVSQPLFRANIRALVSIDDHHVLKDRLSAIKSSLSSYSVLPYQSLRPDVSWPFAGWLHQLLFEHRLPSLRQSRSSILSAKEVASLYHFPLGQNSRTDNLVTSMSRTLPAPLSLKKDTGFDLVLGRNYHHGTETPICISEKERERHVYIIGGTGNGKTTMLQHAIVEDMRSGKGLAVIDPHGDMAETILRHVPEDRLKDVIYFNPDDLLYPIGLNLLELQPGLYGTELMREKDLITESVISVFRKIFSDDDSGGHRIEYVLRNTIQTALTVEGATLFTIFNLLNDPKFRKKITGKLDNPDLMNFWKNELGKAGEFQRVKMAQGITSKIGRFLFSASAKQILEQPKSTIDFDDILNSGKILICNVSKGLLGEDTSELFGITILAKLQLASLRRARLQQSDRRPFFLYVDEFQNFATDSFVQMLSEARKYKLFMLMAEQSTSQQKDQQMVSIILANVGTVICFRTGNPQDERLLLPLFAPYIKAGEISNLPSFNFFAKLAGVDSQEPLSGRTLLLDDEGSQEIAVRVIALSREHYGVSLMQRSIVAAPPPEKVVVPTAGSLHGINPDQVQSPD